MALEVENLSLAYGGLLALDHVSLAVPARTTFGILGPNGCGKSSLFAALLGQRPARADLLRLDGVTLPLGDRRLRRQVGVVFQEPSLDRHLTARENLALSAQLFGLGGGAARRRIGEMLEAVQMQDRADERIGRLSGGMRRRVELARALLHRPTLLLLDEPTSGLDPLAFARTWEQLEALGQQQGTTLLCATHTADEAMRCNTLALLDKGRVVACASPDALLAEVAGDVIVLQARQGEALVAALQERFGLAATRSRGDLPGVDAVSLRQPQGHSLIPRLIETFESGRILSVTLRRPSLADVFLQHTGQALAGDAAPPGAT